MAATAAVHSVYSAIEAADEGRSMEVGEIAVPEEMHCDKPPKREKPCPELQLPHAR